MWPLGLYEIEWNWKVLAARIIKKFLVLLLFILLSFYSSGMNILKTFPLLITTNVFAAPTKYLFFKRTNLSSRRAKAYLYNSYWIFRLLTSQIKRIILRLRSFPPKNQISVKKKPFIFRSILTHTLYSITATTDSRATRL